jgi:hypothetical protein
LACRAANNHFAGAVSEVLKKKWVLVILFGCE